MVGMERVFSRSDILETVKEAVMITEDIDPPQDLRQAVFQGCLAMVGQMRQGGAIQIPQPRAMQ